MEAEVEPAVVPPPPRRRQDASALVLLLVACALVLAASLRVARQRHVIDTSDEAAYSEQADALLAGKGVTVGFVQYHHVPQSPGIEHPEDFYPPGTGALLAVAYRLFDRSEFVATFPALAFACLLLPLLTYLLTRQLGGSPPFACAAGMAALLDPVLRANVYRGLADLPFAGAVLAAVVLAMGGGRTRAALAGAALGVAFYFKPAGLLFVPGLALLRLVATPRPARRNLADLALMAVCYLAVTGPWLLRNQRLYGDPIYSGNKHITALATDPAFDFPDNWKVYWADPDFVMPELAEVTARYGYHAVVTRFVVHLFQAFVEKGGVIFGFVFLAAALLLVTRRRVLAVLLLLLTFIIALSAVFAVEVRYLLPCVPLALAVAWTGLDRVVRADRPDVLGAGTWLARPLRRAPVALPAALLVLAWIFPGAAVLARDLTHGNPAFRVGGDLCIKASGEWVDAHLPPDARVMHHQALRMRYYAHRLTVATPYDTPERMQAVVDRYGVDTIVVSEEGNLADTARLRIEPYLETYGSMWQRVGPAEQDACFTVYRRRSG